MPPHIHILEMASGYYAARCLHMVAEAGIADHLADIPLSADALACEADVHGDTLNRVLRLLAMHGVFASTPEGWIHTDASRTLRSDHPQSVRGFARMIGDPLNWASAGSMMHSLKTGQASVFQIDPEGAWAYYNKHPAQGRVFDEAMVGKSQGEVGLVLQAYDFSAASTIADIGGGAGHFLRGILDAYPHLNGILFDQGDVIAAAPEHPRLTKIVGDFFAGGLPQADVYLLSNIIHDWADAEALAILKSVREAAPSGSHLVMVEQALPDGPEPHPAKNLDIVMLLITGGRERTSAQYASLAEAAGFRWLHAKPTLGPLALNIAIAD